MSRSGYRSELLAAQLSTEMRSALLGANFDDYAWTLQAPSAEIADMLLALKLVRKATTGFQVTTAGMNARAIIARKALAHR